MEAGLHMHADNHAHELKHDDRQAKSKGKKKHLCITAHAQGNSVKMTIKVGTTMSMSGM